VGTLNLKRHGRLQDVFGRRMRFNAYKTVSIPLERNQQALCRGVKDNRRYRISSRYARVPAPARTKAASAPPVVTKAAGLSLSTSGM
jgi:hypothetical protein